MNLDKGTYEEPYWKESGRLSHLGDLMFYQKTLHEHVMHEWVCCRDEAASHQFPIAVAVFVILYLSTDEEHWGSTPY